MNTLIHALLLATTHALPNPTGPLLSTRKFTPRQNQLHPVVVGGPQDTFAPNSLVAAVGDIIQFQFSAGNHTATQSTLDAPCTPLEGGMNSGHIPFEDGQADVGTFNFVVANTEPMFIFCATGPHCQEGQVMVVNPPNAQQVVEFVKRAQATNASVDSPTVAGGSAGKIALANAAFSPPKAKDPAAAPPAEGSPPPAEAEPAAEALMPAEGTPPTAGTSATAEAAVSTATSAPTETVTSPPPAESSATSPEAAPAEAVPAS